jgi:peptidoglycan/LPS O-acetylase OafA/YrhL
MPFILSQFLEACRWLGALVVVAVHATNMFVNFADIMSAPHAPPVYAWWFFASYELGHQAVVGFFVMSGYLVGGSVLAAIRNRKDFVKEYLIHRFARIYVVLVPALILTFVIDSVGRSNFASTGVYDWPIFRGNFTLDTFLLNILNVQGMFANFYGTNGPLWSLACEFWYYITFPLLLLPFARTYSPLTRALGFAAGLAIVTPLLMTPSWFRVGFLLWGMGALASIAPRPAMRYPLLALILYAAAVIPVRLLVRGPSLAAAPWLQDAADLFCALLYLNLIVTLRFAPPEGWAFLKLRAHKTLADFSFSLYSVHMPVVIFLRAAASFWLGVEWPMLLPPTPWHWAALALVLMSCYGVSFTFARITEAHTNKARDVLRTALARLSGPAARAVTRGGEIEPARVE